MKRYHEYNYIFFSEDLYEDQMRGKDKKFIKELEKNRVKLKKTWNRKTLAQYISERGYIHTKGTLKEVIGDIPNPYVNGIEGFYVLQSSIEDDPKRILALFQDRDKAEKLIRNMKEGTELHPIRHWTKWSVIGYLVVIFLTNFLINLTLLKSEGHAMVKNVKSLKKYLSKLTVTIAYPPKGFKFHLLSNISDEIRSILGDYIHRYRDKSLEMRW